MSSVRVRGQGVAASCCAHLLNRAGVPVVMESTGRPQLPAILLGETTQNLIADVFGGTGQFDKLPQIDRRIVRWGADAAPVTLPHRAAVISEEALSSLLRPVLPPADGAVSQWSIYAARPLPAECVEYPFGTRTATAVPVTLTEDMAACWIESMTAGWLFLISTGGGEGWLLAVGSDAESLLAESRMVAQQIRERGSASASFPAYPRMASPLCGAGWLSCGTAAVGFDPICGDGTGYAVREGILAAAVIRAADHGGDADGVRAHYTNRLVAGFQRHLELCLEFYRTGGTGPWWRNELDALEKGVEWCRRTLEGHVFRYRLNNFELQPAG